ncbi:hypothetical protein ZWY2020_001494 [Hordeum vulgare]|nr:hypothetical protein ZWY2020_001494 [Hordeum vulgare]
MNRRIWRQRGGIFFAVPHDDKLEASVRPFGYGSKSIGSNYDMGRRRRSGSWKNCNLPMPLVTSGVEKGNLRELALARMEDLA